MAKNIDFDLDDPLGDLLSDNSNDSFYNDDKSKPATRTQLSSRDASLDKKKSNLFGLDDDPPRAAAVLPNKEMKSNPSGGDWLGLVETPAESRINIIQRPSTSPGIKQNIDKQNVNSSGDLQSTIKNKTSFPDSLNFLDDFGLSDTEPTPAATKHPAKSINKSSRLHDILGKSTSSSKRQETPPTAKLENPNTSTGYSPSSFLSTPISKNVRLSSSSSKLDVERSLPEAKPKPIKAESAIELSKPVKKDASSTSRRQRGNTDWLGLFPEDDLNAKDSLEPKEEIKQNNLPDWLKPVESKQSEEVVSKQSEATNQPKPQPPENVVESGHLATSNPGNINAMYSDLTSLMAKQMNIPEVLGTGSNLNLLNNSDLEQQSAAICLQQQESQLMVALQLKAQEERLAALHGEFIHIITFSFPYCATASHIPNHFEF